MWPAPVVVLPPLLQRQALVIGAAAVRGPASHMTRWSPGLPAHCEGLPAGQVAMQRWGRRCWTGPRRRGPTLARSPRSSACSAGARPPWTSRAPGAAYAARLAAAPPRSGCASCRWTVCAGCSSDAAAAPSGSARRAHRGKAAVLCASSLQAGQTGLRLQAPSTGAGTPSRPLCRSCTWMESPGSGCAPLKCGGRPDAPAC